MVFIALACSVIAEHRPMEKQMRVGYADHKSVLNPERLISCGELFPIPLLVPPQSGRLDAVKPFSLPK